MTLPAFQQSQTTTVGSTATSVLSRNIDREYPILNVVVTNNSESVALSEFKIYGRAKANGTQAELAAAAGDFTTPVPPVLASGLDLTTLAATATGFVQIDARGFNDIEIKAKCGSSASVTLESNASIT